MIYCPKDGADTAEISPGRVACLRCNHEFDYDPSWKLVAVDCPRCNEATKEVFVKPNRDRYCPNCHYTWAFRKGMPEHPAELEVAPEKAAAADTVRGTEVTSEETLSTSTPRSSTPLKKK
jgi:Zn finger protein HypA/HybF involved in hydrogenase expression